MTFTSFLDLTNMTNQTLQQQLQVVVTSGGIDPTVSYVFPTIVLLITYALMWYLVHRHEDIGLGVILIMESGLMLGDPALSSVKLLPGVGQLTLGALLLLAACYHVSMVFMQRGHSSPPKTP